MAGKETPSTVASIRTDSNLPDITSIPLSPRTTSTAPPASPRPMTRGFLQRKMQEAGRSHLSTQEVLHVNRPGHRLANDLLGIGNSFGHMTAPSSSPASFQPPASSAAPETNSNDGGQGATPKDDNLREELKLMHSKNMAVRKKRRVQKRWRDAAAAAVAKAATTKLSSNSKRENAGLSSRSK